MTAKITNKTRITLKDFSALSFEVLLGTSPVPAWSATRNRQPQSAPGSSGTPAIRLTGSPGWGCETMNRNESDKALADLAGGERPTRVLIADDSVTVRESLAKVLRADGYEVELASNGREALDKFKAQRSDVVLMDLDMPETNGWDALDRLLALSPNQAVIIITGKEQPGGWAGVGGSGTLVQKPIDVPALLESIREMLQESKASRDDRVAIQRMLARHTRPLPEQLQWRAYPHSGLNE